MILGVTRKQHLKNKTLNNALIEFGHKKQNLRRATLVFFSTEAFMSVLVPGTLVQAYGLENKRMI